MRVPLASASDTRVRLAEAEGSLVTVASGQPRPPRAEEQGNATARADTGDACTHGESCSDARTEAPLVGIAFAF